VAIITDLDQVKAGAEAIPGDPIPSENDYVCNGNNDGGCTIDWACGGSDGPCLLADHVCGKQVVPVELPAQVP
jgi:hypothetical protein